ncbi:gluconate 5-dehydrogenase [Providencia huaxiensis]|uniref:gluconate 5-dehydrogenase n=1 Tax=Providencia TaxID=586 RepID=UPI000F77465B|nr:MULTISPECIES: gluconate 5-dehydrogenase [Providencia]MBV2189990.1 gluconate 5-dehydrogenase [Providencia rettgeri]HEC8323368.1 gluconate 5-dehydrogenase [Providencia rettgeri]
MKNNLFDLTGKRALITGSSQGLGFTMAKGLGEYGAEIIINSTKQSKADESVRKLKKLNIKAQAFVFDITNYDALNDAILNIENNIGPIDILINNAGIQYRYPLVDFPEENWNKIIDVNQKAVFMLSQQVAKYMIQRNSGKIINICSMQSELGRATIIPYTASKGAVKMMTQGMCAELAKYNIQVNGIAPGYFDTELNKALVEDSEFSEWLYKRTPAARWGRPEELIGAAILLASEASNFINGHIIYVDGGMRAVV